MKQPLIILSMVLALQACGTQQDRQAGTPSQHQPQIQPIPGALTRPTSPVMPLQENEADASMTAAPTPARKERKMAREALAYRVQAASGGMAQDMSLLPPTLVDRENYNSFDDNPLRRAAEHPVSTFSIDVDTGAYANVRRFLNQGNLPNKHAVRVEEMINYFAYDYPAPDDMSRPFNVVTEIAPAPWNADNLLLHVGLKGYQLEKNNLPPANLVFLVDVSGSMQSTDKLPLLKSGLQMLVRQMDAQDRISLVVYAGASGVVLEPTPGDQHAKINRALQALTAGGSTNGAAGIQLAYQMAQQGFIKEGINRIILATDGDFNVGTTNFESLKQLVEQYRKEGVALTTLGFGTGNYNDHLMEQLADSGNGNYAYIDNLNEARKVLVEQMGATLNTIASDVKIQIEFNPSVVAEYRLIGYENRQLKREDFNNDKVDAGEIGAGHSVTALYEISLQGSAGQRLDPLRYSTAQAATQKTSELGLLRLRYKPAVGAKSQLMEQVIARPEVDQLKTSDNFRFAAAVAAFGQQLRGGQYLNQFAYDDILQLARSARGDDHFGYRGEFLQLVALAKTLN